ncbi:MAG: deoxyribonuclease IV [Proteobacteria bacterium]|nr:deoxyribonuclease IV [Pseudomonadota bacterium]
MEKDLLGAHFSIAGGLENALKEAFFYHCTVCQIFTKNASTWRERHLSGEEIKRFQHARKAYNIQSIASHTSYLINLASPDRDIVKKSRDALIQEMNRSRELGLSAIVLHPGSHKGEGEVQGARLVVEGIREVLENTENDGPYLLLETTAGQGYSIGHTFEQIAEILDTLAKPERLGVCLDTSHIFAAGYDIRTETTYKKTMDRFDAVVGFSQLKLIHVNDSKKDLGARVDRHEHIGKGCIGINAFKMIMNDTRLSHIPKIIETPKEDSRKKGKDWDAVNLKQLRNLHFQPNKSRVKG